MLENMQVLLIDKCEACALKKKECATRLTVLLAGSSPSVPLMAKDERLVDDVLDGLIECESRRGSLRQYRLPGLDVLVDSWLTSAPGLTAYW